MIDPLAFRDLSHCERSDIGLVRPNNEDAFTVVDGPREGRDVAKLGRLFVIADGMGGHAAGEVASRIACEETASAYYGQARGGGASPASEPALQRLERSVWAAHHAIIRAASHRAEWRGMGTTLSALALVDGQALIAHVGDSRIYRCRGGSCQRLTIDHTKNQSLIDEGLISQGEESLLYGSHILTQALGGYGDLDEVFTRAEEVRPGDRFLLSTDGLHGTLAEGEIRAAMAGEPTAAGACEALVGRALARGGEDNVTVMVIQW